jgi:hypothetical protein
MWNMDGTLYADLTSAMMEIGLSVQHTDKLTVLLYPANMPLSVNDMPQGRYYLTASVRYSDDNTTDTRYSEVFTAICTATPRLNGGTGRTPSLMPG